MNIFRKKMYAQDCKKMMFYSLLLTVFFLPFSDVIATYTLFLGWFFFIIKIFFSGWQWRKTMLDFPIVIFAVMGILSVINAPEKMFSIYNWTHLVGKYILIYYLTIQTITGKKQIKEIMLASAVAAAGVIAYGFVQYIVGINTAVMGWTDRRAFPEMTMRIYSTLQNPNLLAGYLDMFLAMVFAILVTIQEKKIRIFLGALFILGLICLGLTYARGAFFSIAIVIAGYGICYNRKILLPFIVLLAVGLYADTTLLDRLTSVFGTLDSSAELRLGLWESTIAMILDHPLLGIGWGMYYFVYPTYDFYMQGHFIKIVHAHNMYLNITAEIGIIGFLAFVVCMFMPIYQGMRKYKRLTSKFLRGTLLGCSLAFIALAINGFTDYVLFNTNLSMIFWFLLAVAVVVLEGNSMQQVEQELAKRHVGLTSLPDFPYEQFRNK